MTLYLGIETSCDETGLAIFRDSELISERLFSQEKIHSIYGGVVPEIASRNHLKALPKMFNRLFEDVEMEPEEIDVVCVARGPGLMGSLLVGLGFAKGLVMALGCKLIGVNHLHAHLLVCAMEKEIDYPALGLLISGGHTQIYYIKDPLTFELKGRTLDDAVGEAFDKTAKLLNLPYPGGKFIDRLAALSDPDMSMFPMPYVDNENLDFSFSGLKTSVLNYVRKHPEIVLKSMPENLDEQDLTEIDPVLLKVCSSFNHCVASTLKIKLKRAISVYSNIKSILIAGGVAANNIIREYMLEVGKEYSIPIVIPKRSLCTDNGAMIAFAGHFLYEKGYCHDLDIDAIPRGRPIPWDYKRI